MQFDTCNLILQLLKFIGFNWAELADACRNQEGEGAYVKSGQMGRWRQNSDLDGVKICMVCMSVYVFRRVTKT